MGRSRALAELTALAAVAMAAERRGPISWLATRGVESIDLDDVLAGVDVNALLARVDTEALLARVDLDALLARVDVDALARRIDIDAIARRIEVDALVRRIDLDDLVARLDVTGLVDRIDANRVAEGIDVAAVARRIDVQAVVDRVDIQGLVERVDVQRLVDRVNAQGVVDRVDVQRLVDRVDVRAVVDRAGIADIVADSTGAVAGSVLDVARRQLAAVDTIAERVTYRLVGRDPDTRPGSPRRIDPGRGLRGKDGRALVSGHYAGPVSRTLAFVADCLIVFWLFTAGAAAIGWVLEGVGITPPQDPVVLAALFGVWAFGYWFTGLALTGRTGGKALVGLKVLDRAGGPLSATQAGIRTLALPLSFLVLMLGVAVVLVTPRRTSLHDAIARTCEVYDWGDRPAELPAPLTAWIARRDSQPIAPPVTPS